MADDGGSLARLGRTCGCGWRGGREPRVADVSALGVVAGGETAAFGGC